MGQYGLHFVCPEHEHNGPALPIPPEPPTPGTVPGPLTCTDLNHAIHSAYALCLEIGRVGFYCDELTGDGHPFTGIPIDTGGGGLTPIIPGTGDLEGAKEYCEALKANYKEMQDRWNSKAAAEIALACHSSGWDPEDREEPGDDFSACPNFPPFPVGPGGGNDPATTVSPNCFEDCQCDD